MTILTIQGPVTYSRPCESEIARDRDAQLAQLRQIIRQMGWAICHTAAGHLGPDDECAQAKAA